jgi:hypothetical protein
MDITTLPKIVACFGKDANNDATRTIDCRLYPNGPGAVGAADIMVTAPVAITALITAPAETTYTATVAVPAGTRVFTVEFVMATALTGDTLDLYYVDLVYKKKLLTA